MDAPILLRVSPNFLVCLDSLRIVVVVAVQSCLTLCDPVDCSTPGFPVLCCLLELP